MNSPASLQLIGIYRPRAGCPGFGIPVFGNKDASWVQQIESDDMVSLFVPCEFDSTSLRSVDSGVTTRELHTSVVPSGTQSPAASDTEKALCRTQNVGEQALYAFEAEDGTLSIGRRNELLAILKKDLNKFRNTPFVFRDIAQFANDRELEVEAQELCDRMLRKPLIAPRRTSPMIFVSSTSVELIAETRAMQLVIQSAKAAAQSATAVLLAGETGTGKETIAHAIHRWSARSHTPFLTVNCAALPKNVLEYELFGHVKGAFTGTTLQEPGKIEMAEGGTLFLDEISEMSLPMQGNLLRVLQDRTFYRIGSSQPVQTNVRFIVATNEDLMLAVRQGTFREDLYYRLAATTVALPPLRERLDDLPP